MKIEIRIDKNCDEPKVIFVTDKVTDEINEIVTRLSDKPSQILAGFKDGQAAVLEPEQLYRIYASDGKVYAETGNGTYSLRLRLYEVEQRLTIRSFARKRSCFLCFQAVCLQNQAAVRAMRWLK